MNSSNNTVFNDFNFLSDLFYETDSQGIIIQANIGFRNIFGYTQDELIGKNILDLYVNKGDRELLINALKERDGTVTDFIVYVKNIKEEKIYLSVDSNFIHGKEENGINGIGRDVTSKLNLWGGYFQIDSNGLLLFANKKFAEICNRKSPSEIIKRDIIGLLFSISKFDLIRDQLTKSEFFEEQLIPLFSDKHILLRMHSLFGTNGQLCGYEGTIIDISETLFLQQSLEENRKLLEIVGHELLAPVVAIDGTSENIISEFAKKKLDITSIIQDIEDIQLFNKLMKHLIIDVNITGYGKPLEFNRKLFNFKDLLKSMRNFITPIMKLYDLDVGKISVRYDPDVGNKILGSKLHFMQILFNLFMNFIKYNDEPEDFQAGIDVKVMDNKKRKRHLKISDSIILDVWDTGIGIPKGEEFEILKPGVRASNTSTLPGKGIGLSVAHKIIKHYKGVVYVHSRNNPTIFRIKLPKSIFFS